MNDRMLTSVLGSANKDELAEPVISHELHPSVIKLEGINKTTLDQLVIKIKSKKCS